MVSKNIAYKAIPESLEKVMMMGNSVEQRVFFAFQFSLFFEIFRVLNSSFHLLLIMEVNRENFEEIFPQIRQSIEQCDFLAIDLEMTGLSAGKSERQRPWDSPQERYTKIKLGAAAVCPTQFGLCTFKWRSDLSQYDPQYVIFAHIF